MNMRGKDVYQRCLQVENVELKNPEYYLTIAAQNAKEGHDLHMMSNLDIFLPAGTTGSDAVPAVESNVEQELEAADEEESPVELQTVDKVDHEFVNKLIDSQTAGVATLGSALKEVENNLIRIMNHQFGMVDRALYGMVDREEKMSHVLLQLRSMDLPKMQAAISDVARVTQEKSSNADSEALKKMMDTMQKTLSAQISNEIAKAENRMVTKLQSSVASSSSGMGYWAFIALFQVLFACFIVWRQIIQRYRHDKLL
jgi:hypothetical protein